jgi:SNF2-related domain
MELTDYHAKYLAYELTKRCASDNVEKLAPVLADAQVDLTPHQVDAALFAFRSPFSKGAILADEVGLGKTIEAGLLLAQYWAEHKRRLLVIVPANLRRQWQQELADKFYLPAVILETHSFNEAIRAGNLNPLQQSAVVLCSYQFARAKEPYLRQTPWDLVVLDEAHRLRNVYKATSKIAVALKQALAPFPKLLLTATPLQNSLLELYGLVSSIDEYAFGNLHSYRARFARPGNDTDFFALKERLKPLCKRTLRRQVLEYVKYTNRHALVQEFVPSADEQRLYDCVSTYLQRPTLYALPASQRQLVTHIVDALPDDLPDHWEELDEVAEEWEEDNDTALSAPAVRLTPEQRAELQTPSAPSLRPSSSPRRSSSPNLAVRRNISASSLSTPSSEARSCASTGRTTILGRVVSTSAGWPDTRARIASPVPPVPTCAPRWSSTSATRRRL